MNNAEARIKEIMDKRGIKLDDTSVSSSTDTTTDTNATTLTSGLKPSQYLPIRTARYWADVEAGKEADIAFYKKVNGMYEIHENATKGFDKIVDRTALHQVLRETAYELSLDGESDIAIFKQENKIVPLKIDLVRKQYFPNGALMMYHGLVNFDTGTAPWIMTKKFYYNDKKEVIMENLAYERGKISETGPEGWNLLSNEKLKNKYGIDIAPIINLGMIDFPVITMTNTGADRWGAGVSDTAEVQDVLVKLDDVENAIERAIRTSKTRLYNKRKNGSMDLGDGADVANSVVRQFGEDVEVFNLVEDPHAMTDSQLQITDRNLNVDAWYQVKKTLLQEYYSHTGENVAADAHGNNQHTYEVQSKGDNKYRRATSKRTQRQRELVQLIEMIISMAKSIGIQYFTGLDEISVNINEVDIRKEYEIETKVEKLLNLGLISQVQALMKVEGIDEMTAMRLLAEKVKHEELFKDEEQEQDIISDSSDNNPTDSIQVEDNTEEV